MELFSVVCLFVILFTIQHLLNWFWRKNWKEDSENIIIIGVVASIFSLIVSIAIAYQILEWSKNLI